MVAYEKTHVFKLSCRTKVFMSDESWGAPLLYLPAQVARQLANSGAVPEGANS